MLIYILIIIVSVVLLYVLLRLFEKFMGKHGAVLADRFGGSIDTKKFVENLNHTCLIISFVLLVISVMPEINSVLFVTMAIFFSLRSLRGPMSIFRGAWMFIGSFLMGVVISMRATAMIAPQILAGAFLASIPFLIFGFGKTKIKKKER